MDKPCEHHKTCGDCFGPNYVRTLETTIENLVKNIAESAEIDLATLSELVTLKSSSKNRISRQRNICMKALVFCQGLDIDYGVEPCCRYPRVKEILEGAKSEPEGLSGAVDRWIARYHQ